MFEEKIERQKKLYAVKVNPFEIENKDAKTYWLGKEVFALQASLMSYDEGKTFPTHKHKENPRIVQRNQEAFIVISGKIKVTIYHEDTSPNGIPVPLGALEASAGQMIMVFRGYHKLEMLEKTKCYEVKTGPMINEVVEDDKELLND